MKLSEATLRLLEREGLSQPANLSYAECLVLLQGYLDEAKTTSVGRRQALARVACVALELLETPGGCK